MLRLLSIARLLGSQQDVQLVGDFLRNALAASAGADGGLRQWNLLVADEQGVKLGEHSKHSTAS